MNESQEIEKSEQRESDYFQKVSRNNRVNPFEPDEDD